MYKLRAIILQSHGIKIRALHGNVQGQEMDFLPSNEVSNQLQNRCKREEIVNVRHYRNINVSKTMQFLRLKEYYNFYFKKKKKNLNVTKIFAQHVYD